MKSNLLLQFLKNNLYSTIDMTAFGDIIENNEKDNIKDYLKTKNFT